MPRRCGSAQARRRHVSASANREKYDSAGAWGSWQLLSAADSYIRVDNKGFDLTFLDPDYSFVVYS